MATCAPRSAQIDGLIQAQPNNPYFYELKGQALLEAGRARGGDRAAAPRDRARPRPDADPASCSARRWSRPATPSLPTRRWRRCAALADRARHSRRL